MYNKARIQRTIEVPYESLVYLHEEMHRQRTLRDAKTLSDKTKDRLKRNMPKSGMYILGEGDVGGCHGNPCNAWEEGRWTSWDIETIKKILDDAGLQYGKIGKREVIDVYI